MLSWTGDIHMCRALIIIAIILSFFGSILVLVGMKCTKIGGTEIVNARVTFAGGMNYLIGGTEKLSKSPKNRDGSGVNVSFSSRDVFYGCFLLLWEQNQSGISRPQLRCSEVRARLTSISKCKQSNYILICICKV